MNHKRKPFPFYIAAMLTLFILFLGWAARQAVTNGARITDRDYYSKGLRYNTSRVERQAATSLGWQVNTRLNGRELTLSLTDQQRQPVAGAKVLLTLLHPGEQRSVLLDEKSSGSYRTSLPEALNGELPARYAIELRGARLERRLLINLRD